MNPELNFQLYQGQGSPIAQRDQRVPEYVPFVDSDDPRHYLAEAGLRDAVNVALALGQPLLVTGEPGTGKT
ncbi:MoxR-like ATPase [Candidatus Vecturithrix granuli]|uniref:MoxR-like ATPase n=1 Tax=Vecturithrix granuli TaxID=1499967 RepID=A0A081C5G7_VECG1|nr:MoxR-like ATPase [Candidatus Vecturithrix granuli]